ncbi:MAG: hypothetical protein AB7V50_06505 [Vampirovibrionia bacterium]
MQQKEIGDTMATTYINLIDLTLEIIKANYKNSILEAKRKLANIDEINKSLLIERIKDELPEKGMNENYEKIIAIIESIIQD